MKRLEQRSGDLLTCVPIGTQPHEALPSLTNACRPLAEATCSRLRDQRSVSQSLSYALTIERIENVSTILLVDAWHRSDQAEAFRCSVNASPIAVANASGSR